MHLLPHEVALLQPPKLVLREKETPPASIHDFSVIAGDGHRGCGRDLLKPVHIPE